MKVLTVWQPWASLIAIGAKPYEFRGHLPPRALVGQRIAIHAGARPPVVDEIRQLVEILTTRRHAWRVCLKGEIALPFLEKALAQPELLPLRLILCTAVLGTPRDGHDIAADFGGPVNDSSRSEHANFGWPLTAVEDVVPPEPHTGRQGWSEWGGAGQGSLL